MKKIIRSFIKIAVIILIAYLIYAVIFSIIILAFKRSSQKEKLDTFSDYLPNDENKNKDRVQLIESARDGAEVRIRFIEDAQESIDLSYFTLRDGRFTKILLGSILDAADRGVEVRILLDSMSILPSLVGEPKYALYALEAHPNIELKFYGPLNLLLPFNWNKRLHNKIIIVDEELALIGGRNIADNYYIEDIDGKKFSKDRDVIIFKDNSLEEYHSVLADIKDYFEETWNYKDSKAFRKRLRSKQKIKRDQASENLKREYMATKDSSNKKPERINWHDHTMLAENVEFVHNPVGKINQDPWCLKKLLSLSSQAEESIFMQSPYFIPTRRIKAIYNEYDIDLEKTTLLTNSYYSSPNLPAISGYSRYRKKMVDNDLSIYEYQGKGSIHSKTYIFDDAISVVGSFNLDARSSFLSSESMIVIYSEEFTEKLKNNVQLDLDKSLKVGRDYSYIANDNVDKGKVSISKKIAIAILSKITPLFEHLL